MGLPEFDIPRGSTRNIIIGAVCAVALVAVFLYLLMGGTSPPTTPRPFGPDDHSQVTAVKSLEKEKADLNTCRAALNRLNSDYAQSSKDHPPTLDKETQKQLQKQFNLDDKQIAEIEGGSFTLLDAHHLDQCFLLRDVAQALEGDTRGAGRKSLDRAADAFAWVVRQVRLQEGRFTTVPPQFALRRGWGTALDRAFIYLALLEQLPDSHLHGCLLGWPKGNELPEIWACGVVVDDDPKKMYLFDPRLGLPLPGPKGQGIATLAAARQEDAILGQLTVKTDHPYDVTQKRAQEAEIYEVCSLSALAPRMRFLQDKLLAPAGVQVHLAVDAVADDKRLKAAAVAAATPEKPVPVKAFPYGAGMLRSFLIKEEGGIDEGVVNGATQMQVFSLDLVPWNELPPPFNNQQAFPVNIGLGQRVRGRFAEPFYQFALVPEQARDLMLRGDYQHAIEALTNERQTSYDQLRELKKMKETDPQWLQKRDDWIDRAQRAYALRAPKNDPAALAEVQKKVDDIWKDAGAQVIATLLNGAVAGPRYEETTYYLALCKHELAELAQRRLDVRTAKETPAANAKDDWKDALDWWVRFVGAYPDVPESEAARRLHGETLAMLGKRDEAAKVWETEVKSGKHPLETVACLYLAAQARKK